jgi:hypothetical protein
VVAYMFQPTRRGKPIVFLNSCWQRITFCHDYQSLPESRTLKGMDRTPRLHAIERDGLGVVLSLGQTCVSVAVAFLYSSWHVLCSAPGAACLGPRTWHWHWHSGGGQAEGTGLRIRVLDGLIVAVRSTLEALCRCKPTTPRPTRYPISHIPIQRPCPALPLSPLPLPIPDAQPRPCCYRRPAPLHGAGIL